MSKLTLYYKNGSIAHELKCVDVIPYNHLSTKEVIVKRSEIPYATERFYTNLPYVLEDAKMNCRQPEDNEPKSTVELYSDTGILLQRWSGAKGVSFFNDVVNFKIKDKWLSICGSYIIEENK